MGIDSSIERRLEAALGRLGKIEGMLLGIQGVIVGWQEAKRVYDNLANSAGIRLDMIEAARSRLRLAEAALMKL